MVFKILDDSEQEGTENIIGWEDDGTSFHIHKPKLFNNTILPKYSRKKTLFRSFQRQLNIYGFKMTKKSGVYYHVLFRRDAPQKITEIRPRTQTKKKTSEKDECKDSYTARQSPDYSDDDEATIVTTSTRSYPSHRSTSMSLEDELSVSGGSRERNQMDMEPFNSPIYVAATDPILANFCSTVNMGAVTNFDLFDDLDGIKFCDCNGCGCRFSSHQQ